MIDLYRSLSRNDTRMWSIAIATVASLLLAHGTENLRPLGVAAMALLCAATLLRPAVGLIAAFPLLYALPPAPSEIHTVEALYAAMLIVAFLRQGLPLLGHAPSRPVIIAGVLVLTGYAAINFAAARSHGVPLSDWLRGFAPFAFMAFAVPVAGLLRQAPGGDRHLLAAAGVAALLFSGRVIHGFIAGRLWEPVWYVRQGSDWMRVTEAMATRLGDIAHGPYWERVTALIPQSTDVLVPLALVSGFCGYVFANERAGRRASLVLGIAGFMAALMTLTRSMLLCSLLVICAIFIAAVCRPGETRVRALAGCAVLILAALATLLGFDLGPAYSQRIGITAADLRSTAAQVPPVDANITTRVEEYCIAWKMFRQSPVLGQGLGVRHEMRFATGIGQPPLTQRVGYIHNWPLYMMMVGGVTGLLVYCALLMGPAWLAWRSADLGDGVRALIIASIVLMAGYALFFAVFRLISFNLLLGLSWGLVLAVHRSGDAGNPLAVARV